MKPNKTTLNTMELMNHAWCPFGASAGLKAPVFDSYEHRLSSVLARLLAFCFRERFDKPDAPLPSWSSIESRWSKLALREFRDAEFFTPAKLNKTILGLNHFYKWVGGIEGRTAALGFGATRPLTEEVGFLNADIPLVMQHPDKSFDLYTAFPTIRGMPSVESFLAAYAFAYEGHKVNRIVNIRITPRGGFIKKSYEYDQRFEETASGLLDGYASILRLGNKVPSILRCFECPHRESVGGKCRVREAINGPK